MSFSAKSVESSESTKVSCAVPTRLESDWLLAEMVTSGEVKSGTTWVAAETGERLPPTETVRTVRFAVPETICLIVAFEDAPRSKLALDSLSTLESTAITTPSNKSSALAMLVCGVSSIVAVRFVERVFSNCPCAVCPAKPANTGEPSGCNG